MTIPETVCTTFGFHTQATVPKDLTEGNKEGPPTLRNIVNLAGYVPVLGILIGKGRIEAHYDDADSCSMGARIAMCVRGLFEILGAGLIFLPIDLIVTFFRFTCCDESESSPSNPDLLLSSS